PVLKGQHDLGDLADPRVSTRFAMAYLRDIMSRKPNIKDALTEYNGGPSGRHPHYYRMVMGAYVELLERTDLRCRFQPAPKRPPVGRQQASGDIEECRKLADDYVQSTAAKDVAKGAAVGGAAGAAIGAVGGAVSGRGAGTGAAVGAATGATAGAVHGAAKQ